MVNLELDRDPVGEREEKACLNEILTSIFIDITIILNRLHIHHNKAKLLGGMMFDYI